MAKNQANKGNFYYDNIEKKDKNFMYKNLERSNCYNCNFSGSNFDYVNFRGAHFKTCGFLKASFKWAEFIGTNLKSSNFRNANFENTIFHSVKLNDINFEGSKFKNTIFVSCDLSNVKGLDTTDPEIRIFETMPEIEMGEDLKNAIFKTFNNKFIKSSRILDTKEGEINTLSVMILLENFDEETLIKGLNHAYENIDRKFYTLSYLIKLIKNIEAA